MTVTSTPTLTNDTYGFKYNGNIDVSDATWKKFEEIDANGKSNEEESLTETYHWEKHKQNIVNELTTKGGILEGCDDDVVGELVAAAEDRARVSSKTPKVEDVLREVYQMLEIADAIDTASEQSVGADTADVINQTREQFVGFVSGFFEDESLANRVLKDVSSFGEDLSFAIQTKDAGFVDAEALVNTIISYIPGIDTNKIEIALPEAKELQTIIEGDGSVADKVLSITSLILNAVAVTLINEGSSKSVIAAGTLLAASGVVDII